MEPINAGVYCFPVSVKGIVCCNDKILLLKNERDEWELPGGKLELGETPEGCVEREILEEVGLATKAVQLIDVWVYTVFSNRHVLIVTFLCSPVETGELMISHEHQEGAWFTLAEMEALHMPEGYKHSIRQAI